MKMFALNFYGLNEPINPGGVACWGFVIKFNSSTNPELRDTVVRGHGVLGAGMLGKYTTNNFAEYSGLINALQYLLDHSINYDVLVMGDSKLVINQLNGIYSVKSPNIFRIFKKAYALYKQFNNIEIKWVPREQNAEADEQTNIAFVEFVIENKDKFFDYYKKYTGSEKLRSIFEKYIQNSQDQNKKSKAQEIFNSYLRK